MFCRKCGQTVDDRAMHCSACQHPTGIAPAPQSVDPAMSLLVPLGRSGLSIAAGYLGLLAVTSFLAPIALLVSILAIRELRRKPELKGMGRAVFGLIMGVVFTLILAVFVFSAVSR